MISKRLHESVLQSAISGELIKHSIDDGSVDTLLTEIAAWRNEELLAKKGKKTAPIQLFSVNDIPFEIPGSWRWVRFEDVCNFRIGKTPARADSQYWLNGEIPWVSIADMQQGKVITETRESVSQSAFDKHFGSTISPAGTVLMSFKLTIGKCSVLGVDAVHNEAIISIFPYPPLDSLFSDYLMLCLPLLSRLGVSKGAIKGRTLNSKSIRQIPIPVPPLRDQERIVAKLIKVIPEIEKLAVLEEELANL